MKVGSSGLSSPAMEKEETRLCFSAHGWLPMAPEYLTVHCSRLGQFERIVIAHSGHFMIVFHCL